MKAGAHQTTFPTTLGGFEPRVGDFSTRTVGMLRSRSSAVVRARRSTSRCSSAAGAASSVRVREDIPQRDDSKDLATWSIYADVLQHPRGALIALALRAEQDPARAHDVDRMQREVELRASGSPAGVSSVSCETGSAAAPARDRTARARSVCTFRRSSRAGEPGQSLRPRTRCETPPRSELDRRARRSRCP